MKFDFEFFFFFKKQIYQILKGQQKHTFSTAIIKGIKLVGAEEAGESPQLAQTN